MIFPEKKKHHKTHLNNMQSCFSQLTGAKKKKKGAAFHQTKSHLIAITRVSHPLNLCEIGKMLQIGVSSVPPGLVGAD